MQVSRFLRLDQLHMGQSINWVNPKLFVVDIGRPFRHRHLFLHLDFDIVDAEVTEHEEHGIERVVSVDFVAE